MPKKSTPPAPPDPLPAARAALLAATPPDLLSATWRRKGSGGLCRATAAGLYGADLAAVVAYREVAVVLGRKRLDATTRVVPLAEFLRDFERAGA